MNQYSPFCTYNQFYGMEIYQEIKYLLGAFLKTLLVCLLRKNILYRKKDNKTLLVCTKCTNFSFSIYLFEQEL